MAQVIAQYAGAEVVWCQEEPKNMGAHAYVRPRIATALRELCEPTGVSHRPLRYVGRTASASVGAHAEKLLCWYLITGRMASTIHIGIELPYNMLAKYAFWVPAATASIAIHRMEMREIIDAALSPAAMTEDHNI